MNENTKDSINLFLVIGPYLKTLGEAQSPKSE